MNILKFLIHLLKKRSDFSFERAKKDLKEIFYAILLFSATMSFSFFVACLFDLLTFYKFYDMLFPDDYFTITEIFALKSLEGLAILSIISLISVIIYHFFSYIKKEWAEWKNF
jgi:hypothetical protein